MTAVDSLMLDAKQAIMDEHHRRFQTFHQEGRWEEALQEIHVTLRCASDLLNESLRVIDETLDGSQPHLARFLFPFRNHIATKAGPALIRSPRKYSTGAVIGSCSRFCQSVVSLANATLDSCRSSC